MKLYILFISMIYRRRNETEGLSVEKLIEFLNDKQRDPRLNEILFPMYDRERVLQIIDTYEKDPQMIKKGRYRHLLY